MKTTQNSKPNDGYSYRITSTLSFIIAMLLILMAEVSSSQVYWGPDTTLVSEPMSWDEAQDYVFGNLTPHMETDVLLDRGWGEISRRKDFSGIESDSVATWDDYFAIYTELLDARISNNPETPFFTLLEKAQNQYLEEDAIPFGILDFKYEQIDSSAMRPEVLEWVNNKVVVNAPDYHKIFKSNRAFIASPLLARSESREFKLKIDSSFYFANHNEQISYMELTVGEYGEPTEVYFGDILNLAYYETDTLHFSFNIHFENGEILSCKSILDFSNAEFSSELESRSKKSGKPKLKIYTYGENNFYPKRIDKIIAKAPKGKKANVSANVAYYYACDNYDEVLRKPYIVCTGYSPFGGTVLHESRRKSNAYDLINGSLGVDAARALGEDYNKQMNNGSNLLYRLRNEGYDVVIVDFDNGVDYIQNAAALVVEAIKLVNMEKATIGSYHENVIQGISMSGVAVRYALALMEQEHYRDPQNNRHHHCRMFISYEGEMQGAYIPMGIQAGLAHLVKRAPHSILYHIADQLMLGIVKGKFPQKVRRFFPDTRFLQATYFYRGYVKTAIAAAIGFVYKQALDNPAARSMLMFHYEENDSPSRSQYSRTQEFVELYSELDSLGYPQDCRLVAVANASNRGDVPQGVNPGSLLFDIEAENLLQNYANITARVENEGNNTEVFAWEYKFRGIKISKGSLNKVHDMDYSFSSGSYEGFYAHYFMPFAITNSKNGNDFAPNYRAPFVPIESTFDIQGVAGRSLTYDALNQLMYTAPNTLDPDRQKGYPHNSPHFQNARLVTPFDAVFASEEAEFHVGNPSKEIADFILDEVSSNFQVIQNDSIRGAERYAARYESRNHIIIGEKETFKSPRGGVIVDSLKKLRVDAAKEIGIFTDFHARHGSIFFATLKNMNDSCFEFHTKSVKKSKAQKELSQTDDFYFSENNLVDESCLKLYPNPSNSSVTISGCNFLIKDIQLLDARGIILAEYSMNNNQTKSIDLTNIPSGVYFVKLQNQEQEETLKLVKQ